MGIPFNYPVPKGEGILWLPDFRKRLLLGAKDLLSPFRRREGTDGVELSLVGEPKDLDASPQGCRVVFLCHNDRRLLPAFIDHYRRLGVIGFACVDDRSDDGSREYLMSQPDVDLYQSNIRYREARRGRIWRERLMDLYGRDRWYLNVDSDEFFVHESFGREPVDAYARRLYGAGVSRLPSPMLDLYPLTPLSDAVLPEGKMPWEIATHFDGDGYRASVFNTGISIYGGVRARVFDAPGELIKYPLIHWHSACSMGRTIHRPRPARDNFAPAMGVLLHFKIFSDVRDMAARAVKEGQHHDGALLYRRMLERLEQGEASLGYERSIRYRDVNDLIDRGFVVPLDRSGTTCAR